MQYTGLKDKHGKEIYEGDIIAFEGHHWDEIFTNPCIVKFEYGCFYPWGSGDWKVPSNRYEIIGNIYENTLEAK
jgi:hypothetical protein